MSRNLLFAGLLPVLSGCPMDGEMTGPMDLAPPPDPLVRIAHYTAGAPAFDVCVKGPDDTSFIGPIISTKAQHAGGVPYASASAYVALPPAAYRVRAVPGSATDCNTSLGGLPDIDVMAVRAGRRYTVAAMGYLSPPLNVIMKVVLLEDDNTQQAGQARLRFVHAAAKQSSLDLGSDSGASYVRRFTAPSFGSVADTGGGQAYLVTAPQTQATYSLRATGSGNELATFLNKLNLAAGEVYTVTAIGVSTSTSSPLSLSLCADTAAPIDGLTNCQELR